MEVRYLIVIAFILIKVSVVFFFFMLKCLVRAVIDGKCVVLLAPAVITMRGATFHP
jgi:hypothetical protein